VRGIDKEERVKPNTWRLPPLPSWRRWLSDAHQKTDSKTDERQRPVREDEAAQVLEGVGDSITRELMKLSLAIE
jgi:hypothetical protein